MQSKGLFITGTDTAVGKTIVTAVLGCLLQKKGFDVGVMKPVQCAGNDAQFLKNILNLDDPLKIINPFFAPEPLSPHLAFSRARKEINIAKIMEAYRYLQSRHEIVLVEGAGGLLVPLKKNYLVADLIKDLDLDVVIISRLALGTINHSLLTIQLARQKGIKVRGIIFSEVMKNREGIPEKTNPRAVQHFGDVTILGIVPHLKSITRKEILKRCSAAIDWKILLREEKVDSQKFARLDKDYLWHPFTQMKDWLKAEPLVIEEARGCYLKDTRGRWYLDGVSSLWVNVHGHRRKEIDDAIRRQINKVSHSTLLGLSNVPAVELAQKLVEIAPKGLQKVFYSDNGSTAVEVALKIAYQYWQNTAKRQKQKIVYFENSYHGDTLGSVSVGGIDLFHKVYRKLIFKAVKATEKNFERGIKRSHKTIAAVI